MKKLFVLGLGWMVASVLSASAVDVKPIWEKACAKCHGMDGKGDTKAGKKVEVKDMTDSKWQSNVTDEKAFKSIKEGLKDGDKIRMKPAENVSDEEIKALVQLIRGLKK